MASPKKTLTLVHHDFQCGWQHHIPLHLEHRWKQAVREAVEHSAARQGAAFRVTGTPFLLEASVATELDGNMPFWIAAAEPLMGGKVAARSMLYSACVASTLATAPQSWRFLQDQYLRHMLSSPSEARFGAPGLMPRECPWLCGYPECGVKWEKKEWNELLVVVRLAGLALLERGLLGLQRTAAKGLIPAVDPVQYIELRDWSG